VNLTPEQIEHVADALARRVTEKVVALMNCECNSCHAARTFSFAILCCPLGFSHGVMCACGASSPPAFTYEK
jgi:hypothetical protein